MKLKKFFSLLIFFFLAASLFSESFRVRKAHVIHLQNENSEIQIGDCNIYDAAAIYLPQDRTFIEGIEIKMIIPEAIASWRNTVAASIYDKISPEPTNSQIDYSGTRIFVSALPGKLSWVIQVPLKTQNSIKENQYSTKIDTTASSTATNIFVKFQPVMKGIPEEVMNSKIGLSARPIFSDKGRLVLNLSGIENKNQRDFTLYIDDAPVNPDKEILLKTGIHNLSIISENYRNEVRTFFIDQAKTTTLDIDLKGVEPAILITAPEGVRVFLDGKEMSEIGKEMVISEGEHSIKFEIGSYEVIRSITAVKGKTYKANLDVDLTISDGTE